MREAPAIAPPIKPILTIDLREDGGICLDAENAARLGHYILGLERAAGAPR